MPQFFKRIPRRGSLGAASLAAIFCMGSAPARETATEERRACPAGLRQRTPLEAIEEHLALLRARDLEGALCDYAPDAVVILPGQVASGLDEIRTGLSGFAQLFGDAVPEIDSLTSVNSVVLLTFHVVGPELSIPAGSDTYIVKKGLIQYQTVHDVIVPTAPPAM
jgi:SnoaL-like protein